MSALDWNHVVFLLFYLLVSIHHTLISCCLHCVSLVLHFLLKQLITVPKNYNVLYYRYTTFLYRIKFQVKKKYILFSLGQRLKHHIILFHEKTHHGSTKICSSAHLHETPCHRGISFNSRVIQRISSLAGLSIYPGLQEKKLVSRCNWWCWTSCGTISHTQT